MALPSIDEFRHNVRRSAAEVVTLRNRLRALVQEEKHCLAALVDAQRQHARRSEQLQWNEANRELVATARQRRVEESQNRKAVRQASSAVRANALKSKAALMVEKRLHTEMIQTETRENRSRSQHETKVLKEQNQQRVKCIRDAKAKMVASRADAATKPNPRDSSRPEFVALASMQRSNVKQTADLLLRQAAMLHRIAILPTTSTDNRQLLLPSPRVDLES